jgi:hypothetical protein
VIDQDVRDETDQGHERRKDGFFDDDGELRSDAAELLEGILRQAAASHEERKVPYLAHIFAGVAFEPTVSADDAQFLVRVAGELTYRQFVLLAVLAHRADHLHALMNAWAARQEGTALPDPAILAEIDDAASRRLIGAAANDDDYVYGVGEAAGTLGAMSRTEYSTLRLTRVGEAFVRLTRLDSIDEAERREWLDALLGEPI